MRLHAYQLLAVALNVLVLVYCAARRRSILQLVSHKRVAAAESRLRLARHEHNRLSAAAQRPRLALQLKLGLHSEKIRVRRLRELGRELEHLQQRTYEARRRSDGLFGDGGIGSMGGGSPLWHGVRPDGVCPADVPQWDWQLLLKAAAASSSSSSSASSSSSSSKDGSSNGGGSGRSAAVARAEALRLLSQQSGIGEGELSDIAHKYASVLRNPEFDGILDPDHPECDGHRFASIEGDRILRIQCDEASGGASYALDGEHELHTYVGPTRIESAESVIAFCGERYNLLSHPRRHDRLVERARARRHRQCQRRAPRRCSCL